MCTQIIPFSVRSGHSDLSFADVAPFAPVDVTAIAQRWGFSGCVVTARAAFDLTCAAADITEEAWNTYDLTRAAWFSRQEAGGEPAVFRFRSYLLVIEGTHEQGAPVIKIDLIGRESSTKESGSGP